MTSLIRSKPYHIIYILILPLHLEIGYLIGINNQICSLLITEYRSSFAYCSYFLGYPNRLIAVYSKRDLNVAVNNVMYLGLHTRCPKFLYDLTVWNLSTNFQKIPNIKFQVTLFSGNRADKWGQADGRMKEQSKKTRGRANIMIQFQ
jgi:hypothetical protein